MYQTVEVIKDSIGPNKQRISSLLITHWRGIHAELLRHRLFSFSVASSRAIPYKIQREQVENDPMLPILWPKQHTGMQGTEVFPNANHADSRVCAEDLEKLWLEAKNSALYHADRMGKIFNNETKQFESLSKQLTNRLLEPWVATRAVITATDWDNFFELRAPWHLEDAHYQGHDFERMKWEDDVNLEFPAEYNIQDLAIKMRKALDESTPEQLEEGAYHLPFIDYETKEEVANYLPPLKLNPTKEETLKAQQECTEVYCKISAARCARTSYGKNIGKSIEKELELADILLKEKHLSPFEHQAMATNLHNHVTNAELFPNNLIDGMEARIQKIKNNYHINYWSGNFQGWVQNRKTLEVT